MKLFKNATVLFQGDSITDCGRSFEDYQYLGGGYVAMVRDLLNYQCPHLNLKFINRGISGNRVADLQERWESDCIDLKPDVLSVLIGVNDTWRRYDSNLVTTADEYYLRYKDLLTQVRQKLPNTAIVLLEPFLLPVNERIEGFYDDLDDKIKKVRKLATEFGATYIPLDGLFAQAATIREPAFWSGDGVHPSSAGHMLIAQNWVKTING